MKKLLLLLLIIPVFGHSQKPNQSSFPNYFDGFSQNLDIDMKQINQEFDNREIITDSESTDSYRLDEQTFVSYDIDGVIDKSTLQFNENGKVISYTKSIFTSTSIVGTWKLAREAGAIGVGPDKGDSSWWSSSSADLTRMDCLFDDEYVFNEDGTFENILGLETWLEPWQGLDEEGCGAAVYPHDGGTNYNYTYDMQAKTLKLNGKGAHIGLAKVYNLGELSSPSDAVDEITYIAELSSDGKSLQLSIERELMGGFWTFKLVRDNVSGSSLVPSFKNESSFDSNGNQTLRIRYYWDTESQSFVPGNKYEYNYDENGNQTLYLSYGWSSESQSFVPSGKSEYYYDANGNHTLYFNYGWSSESNLLFQGRK